MPVYVAIILGILAALAATIVAFVMIVPEKKRAGLNNILQWVHDFFNFKTLWIEKIMKFLYVLNTLTCIGVGFFMLFSVQYRQYMGGYGFLIMIIGPVVTRILYEFIMLTILLVKNTIEINNKLVAQDGSVADKKAKEDQAQPYQQAYQYPYQQPYQQSSQQPYQQPYQQPVQTPDQNNQQ